MAFNAISISVGGTPTLLINPSTGSIGDPVPAVIFNNDAALKLFIGGPTVSAANGFPIVAQSGIGFRLITSDPVYGISGGANIDARVLIGRQ
jgi:hypothetical protein